MKHYFRGRLRLAGAAFLLAAAGAAVWAATGIARATASPIRIAILSDCQGAFGSFDNQDIGGAISAFAQYTGARPKNPNKPHDGMTGGKIGNHPIKLVGIGCSNDRADTAIKETKRLMEQLKADILIGPLSGDESIAVANYAKSHPNKTFVDGSAGAQDTTLKVRARNFFRFNGDGAQWNAGLGDIAHRILHWKNAAVIADDYSFAWTSAAGFIAEFCAVGGKVTNRVFPPLNTTDYSSYVQQLPEQSKVDGYFWAVGGSGLLPALKAFEQAKGPINAKKTEGNLFWGTPGEFQALGNRVGGAYVGGAGTAPDLKTKAALFYTNHVIGKYFKKFPPFPGSAASQAASTFTHGFYINTVGLIKGLKKVHGNLAHGQKALQRALARTTVNGPYGRIVLDRNRQGIMDQYVQQLFVNKKGKLDIKTVYMIPSVNQTFGSTFSTKTPAPGRSFPACVKRKLPWVGHERKVVNGVVK